MYRKVCVQPSTIPGQQLGLFATCTIQEEEMVCPFVGEKVTNQEMLKRYGLHWQDIKQAVPHPDLPNLYSIDATHMATSLARYAAESPDKTLSNCVAGASIHMYGSIVLYATKQIHQGDEIII